MANTRSPNYPQLNYEEALDRIKKVYNKEHTHPTKDTVIVEHLGYKGLNGTSAGVVSALKKYGLLDATKDGSKVSDDAVAIMELPANEIKRIEAIRRTAFLPTIFAELHDHFGSNLPSDSNLRYYLLQKKFNPRVADEVIRNYHDTVDFVEKETSGYTGQQSQDISTHDVSTMNMQSTGQPSRNSLTASQQREIFHPQYESNEYQKEVLGSTSSDHVPIKHFRFPITGTSEVKIELIGDVTPEAIEAVKIHLDAQIKILELENRMKKSVAPQRSSPIAPQTQSPNIGEAIWKNKDADLPVIILGEAGEHEGRKYLSIEGSDTAIPADEVEFKFGREENATN